MAASQPITCSLLVILVIYNKAHPRAPAQGLGRVFCMAGQLFLPWAPRAVHACLAFLFTAEMP